MRWLGSTTVFDCGGSIRKHIPTLGLFLKESFTSLRKSVFSETYRHKSPDSVAHKDKSPEPCILPFWLSRSFMQMGILYSGLDFSWGPWQEKDAWIKRPSGGRVDKVYGVKRSTHFSLRLSGQSRDVLSWIIPYSEIIVTRHTEQLPQAFCQDCAWK